PKGATPRALVDLREQGRPRVRRERGVCPRTGGSDDAGRRRWGLPPRPRGKGGEMTVVGFHASHEQVHPAALLEAVQHAEEAGFSAAMCSDHFAPWSERQGESGFAWSWLGAALATTGLTFGVVNAPGQR